MIHFLSFADTNLQPSLNRIKNQAFDMLVFDKIHIFNQRQVPNHIKQRIRYVIKQTGSKRGFGYWCWKPALINHIIKTEAKDGDLLLYCDAGCELNPLKSSKLIEYFDLTKQHDILVTQFEDSQFADIYWCKADTISLFEKNMQSQKLHEGQIQGGIVFLMVNQYTRKIIDRWEELLSEKNLHYFDDSPSVAPNCDGFKQHRHDQSILSLLLKSEHYYSLSVEQHCGTGLLSADRRAYLKAKEPIVSFGNKIKKKVFNQTEFYLCIRYPKYFLGKLKRLFIN